MAYDLSVIDRLLSEAEVHELVSEAARVSNDPTAIRSVRQIKL
jgi:hypothetical protein